MKKDIHPAYKEATVNCGCGNSFVTRSTSPKILIEVCANCHPFFTGKQKFIDTAGMMEKFTRKWQGDAATKAKAVASKAAAREARAAAQDARSKQTLAATLGAPNKPAAKPPAPKPAVAAPPKPGAPVVAKAPAPAAPKPPAAPAAKPGEPAKKA